MKLWLKVLVVAAVAILVLSIYGVTVGPVVDAQTEPVTVSIDGVDLKDVGANRVRLQVRSHITATRKIKVKRVRFEHMRFNNLPIYLSPIADEVQLQKGVPVVLPPVPVSIYFRDLDSVAPLEQLVREEQATVQGNARIDLDLNLIERIASGQWDARVEMPFELKVPIDIPVGFIGQQAALLALDAAQAAMNLGGSALNVLRQSQKAWDLNLRTHYIPAVVVAESRYSLRMRDNHRADFSVRGLGFRISEDKFVLTGEMMEPWKYQADIANALKNGQAALLEDGRDLLVWLSGEALQPGSARSLSQGSIHLEHESGKPEVDRIPSENKSSKITMLQRDSNENYAVLRFTRGEDRGTAIQLAPEQVRHSHHWDRLALFRVDSTGTLELINTPARAESERIQLEDPIDEGAFGSLLVAPEGAVGMVQDENSGMLLRRDW